MLEAKAESGRGFLKKEANKIGDVKEIYARY
jgi:hypothetical protein